MYRLSHERTNAGPSSKRCFTTMHRTGIYGVPTGFPLIPRVLRRPMRGRKTADASGDLCWDAGGPEPSIPSGITGLGLRARWWTPQAGRKNNGGEAEIRTLERVAPSTAFEILAIFVPSFIFTKSSLGEAGFKGALCPQVRSTHGVPAQRSLPKETEVRRITAPRPGTRLHVLCPSRTEQTRCQL